MATISDDFNRADGGPGANYTTIIGAPVISSNYWIQNGTDPFNPGVSRHNTPLDTNDVDISGVALVANAHAVVLYARILSGAEDTQGYGAEVRHNASGLLVSLLRLPNDAGIYVIQEQQSGISATGDHTLRMTIRGSLIKIYVDGIEQISRIHTAYPTGTYAMLLSEYNDSGFNSFTASDATPATGIEYIGQGDFAVGVTASGNVLGAFPTDYTAVTGDVGILWVQGLHNTGSSLAPTAPSGWTQITTQFQNIATYDLQITAYRRVLVAGDSAPNVVCPTAYSTSAGGMSVYMQVFRGVHTTTVEDATAVVSSGAAAATFTPTGITTVTPNAMAVSGVATADDNLLNLSVSQSFVLRAGGPITASGYDTTTGGDHAMGAATKQLTAPGAVTCPTWSETVNGNDAWAAITIALRSKYIAARPLVVRQAVNRGAVR